MVKRIFEVCADLAVIAGGLIMASHFGHIAEPMVIDRTLTVFGIMIICGGIAFLAHFFGQHIISKRGE